MSFQADLLQAGAILSGTTTERNTFDYVAGDILTAELFGSVHAHSLQFVKRYTNVTDEQHAVTYSGTVSDCGDLITGMWRIRASWSGGFRIHRAVEQEPRKAIVTANENEPV